MCLAYMEGAMESSTSMSTPPDEVDRLIQMVGDEYGLQTGEMLDSAGHVGTNVPAQVAASRKLIVLTSFKFMFH